MIRKLTLAILVAALYLAPCAAVRVLYRFFVYSPPSTESVEVPTGAELLKFRASDGIDGQALWFPPAPGEQVVVYFHGGGGSIASDVPLGGWLRQQRFGVLLVEYRGYGGLSEARPSEAGLYADADAALDEIRRRGVTPDRVALWGYSLGTGVAAEMAARGKGASLVLVAPFTSIVDVARQRAPWLPMALLLPNQFDTLAKVARIRVPTLIVHGDRDTEIPFAEGQRLADAIPGARFLPVTGAGHEDVYDRGGAAIFGVAFAMIRK